MPKAVKTAAELKHLIQIRMNALEEAEEDGEQVFARDVDWHEPDEAAATGTWTAIVAPQTMRRRFAS